MGIDSRDAGAVLVLTSQDDPTADAVMTELAAYPARVVRLDTGDFPSRLRLAATSGQQGWRGRLWSDLAEIDLNDIVSVYYRRPTRFTFPDGLSDGDRVFASVEARLGFGGVLACLDALWVNDPIRVAVAEYKPAQLKAAARAGLSVPRTLVTNDYEAAAKFAATIGRDLVCKALSSLVLSENGVAQAVYTRRVSVTDIGPTQLAVTAHLLQEWVPKAYDARVTMVGQRPHAVAIHAGTDAGRVDWRADYANLTYEPITPPDDVTAGMVRYLAHFGLHYGAFDFVVTPTHDWIFLECNPNGQWLWLQEQAGLPIAAGLAELLAKGAAT